MIEGNYRETFDLRLPRADTVIVLEAPRWLRLLRVSRRVWSATRVSDLPEGCPEHWDWDLLRFIWHFDRRTWPQIEAARMAHGAHVPVTRLRSTRQISAFLESVAVLRDGDGLAVNARA